MSNVFISYRRDDTQGYAGRLYDDLIDKLGSDHVFRDIDTIEAGNDFVEVLDRTLSAVRVLIVLIGPTWLTVTDANGRRRLDSPTDLVRMEVSRALAREDVVVVPVLVEDARMPRPGELPENLQALSRRQYLELSDKRWKYDVGKILDAVQEQAPGLGRSSRRAFLASGVAGVTVAGLAVAAWRFWLDDSTSAQYRTDGCKPGYVWREAYPGDAVCVVKEQADQARLDNAAASSRIDPNGDYGPLSCLQGYVWRVANEADLVCVEVGVRQRVAEDNATAEFRSLQPNESE